LKGKENDNMKKRMGSQKDGNDIYRGRYNEISSGKDDKSVEERNEIFGEGE